MSFDIQRSTASVLPNSSGREHERIEFKYSRFEGDARCKIRVYQDKPGVRKPILLNYRFFKATIDGQDIWVNKNSFKKRLRVDEILKLSQKFNINAFQDFCETAMKNQHDVYFKKQIKTVFESVGIKDVPVDDLCLSNYLHSAVRSEKSDDSEYEPAQLIASVFSLKHLQINEKKYFCCDLCIGKGGFKEVYVAINRAGKIVCIAKNRFDGKASCVDELNKTEKLIRNIVIAEAKLMKELTEKKLKHVVKLLDSSSCNPVSPSTANYLVMEYCNGGTLGKFLKDNKNMSLQDKLGVCIDIAKGLNEIHKEGFVHRDLKLDNVFVKKSEKDAAKRLKVKIGDFGLMGKNKSFEKGIVGTYNYFPPEIACKNPEDQAVYNTAVDQWALGVVFYEFLFEDNFISVKEGDKKIPKEEILQKIVALSEDSIQKKIEEALGKNTAYAAVKECLKSFLLGILNTNPEERCSAENCIKKLEELYPSKFKSWSRELQSP